MSPKLENLNDEMEQLAVQFPTAQLPPNCVSLLRSEFLEYESRTMLKVRVPVAKEFLNPMHTMQGGIITAAFDNTFGPLSYLAARSPCTTLDLHTNFIRPIKEGDTLIITGRVISRSPISIHLSGEAVNEKGKLVATCTSHMVVIKTTL
jgi:uncharacterized protein (TIGR00369 family)